MEYTLNNILDEANTLVDAQDTSINATLAMTDDLPNDDSLCELLAFLRNEPSSIVTYTHG